MSADTQATVAFSVLECQTGEDYTTVLRRGKCELHFACATRTTPAFVIAYDVAEYPAHSLSAM